MANSSNQKIKILYIARMLLEKTDSEHGVTIKEIISEIEAYGLTAERKALYSDLDILRDCGFDIQQYKKGGKAYYHICSRTFELPELKLLVDCIRASKFISEKKARSLINKIGTLTSKHHAGELNRQVYLSGSKRAYSETLFYTVDAIHHAINNNKKISFVYSQWGTDKQIHPRRDGEHYLVSPWGLVWDDEYYYLIGYDEEMKLKHYRVDKMTKTEITDKSREGAKLFHASDLEAYDKKNFNMYGGEQMNIKLYATDAMAPILIDRFGRDIPIITADKGHFNTTVSVALSNQLLGWIFSLSPDVKIVGPAAAVKAAKELATELAKQYK